MTTGIKKTIPNLITFSRLIFTVIFIALLGWADYGRLNTHDVSLLDWAMVMFLLAGLSDVLDGAVARRLKVTSAFGRMFDPLVDKILVIGAFAVMAYKGSSFTGVAWWMVAVILAREFLVTVIRHWSESHGHAFAATWAGKLKMFLQSITIAFIIVYLAYWSSYKWAFYVRNIALWITVLFTAATIFVYLPRINNEQSKSKPNTNT